MKILITGGAGFIGGHLAAALDREGAEIRILDNFRSGSRKNILSENWTLIEGSVLSRECVREAVSGVDYVFHLAAMISVPESMAKMLECVEINTHGTIIVLEESARAGVKKLCFSSSAAIYGNNPVTPKKEDMFPEPRSPYAVTKLDGEYYCHLFTEQGLLQTTCLRYFNVFGPRQNPKSQYAAAVPGFIDRALQGLPLVIYGDGCQTRDFVSVEDVVAANLFFAIHSDACGVFNVGYGQSTRIIDLAREIIALTGSESPIIFERDRQGDVRHSQADVTKLLQCGFNPVSSVAAGLRVTVDSFGTSKLATAFEDCIR